MWLFEDQNLQNFTNCLKTLILMMKLHDLYALSLSTKMFPDLLRLISRSGHNSSLLFCHKNFQSKTLHGNYETCRKSKCPLTDTSKWNKFFLRNQRDCKTKFSPAVQSNNNKKQTKYYDLYKIFNNLCKSTQLHWFTSTQHFH